MIDFLVQSILSNLIVATVLAVIAWLVQRRTRNATLSNLLWALVLIKIVTPPLFSIPILEIPNFSRPISLANESANDLVETDHSDSLLLNQRHEPIVADVPLSRQDVNSTADVYAMFANFGLTSWIAISCVLFVVSVCRIIRFHILLLHHSHLDKELGSKSAHAATEFRLARPPDVLVTNANIAPFVWWISGRAVIVISKNAIEGLSEKDLSHVLYHEMAHIKRFDHALRWLEWLAVIGFWWNPVMWWARCQLRRTEEMACDDLVLQTTSSEVHQYANSLLNMAEILAPPTIRPPVLASAINSGGILETRLKMMIDKNTWRVPTALRLAVIVGAIFVFPLGVVYATQELDAVERRLGSAVEAGEISLKQANVMMEALRRFNQSSEMEEKKRAYSLFTREIEAAVKAGKLSKAEAEEKLIAQRRNMFRNKPVDQSKREMDQKRRMEQIAAEIKAAVEAGEISSEQAREKMKSLRRDKFWRSDARDDRHRDDALLAQKKEYMQVTHDIKAAVEAGELSKAQAEAKLIELRKAMSEKGMNETSYQEKVKKQQYQDIENEIRAAIEAGEISAEEAELRLVELRRRIFENFDKHQSQSNEAKQKQKYMRISRDIEAALEAGELSHEEAKHKLLEIRKRMFESNEKAKEKDQDESDSKTGKLRLEILRAIDAAVNSGELSQEDAKKKLLELEK